MKNQFWPRRTLLAAGALGASSLPTLLAQEPAVEELFPENGAAALTRLRAGNARFIAGKTRHAHEGANWRKHLVGGQRPIATILSCSDSRVPPELVFDQGFGDLFVVRVAGNVIAADVLGSISYAALHLRTPLFVVMGHASCGAVTAALDHRLKDAKEPGPIAELVKLIDPALQRIKLDGPYATTLAAAVEANVRWSVEQLAATAGAKALLREGKTKLIGGVYELQTGEVNFLDG